jgi:hypothetical protein
MVLAEKIITAVQRGTANTRWRDFVDVYLLTGAHRLSSHTGAHGNYRRSQPSRCDVAKVA